MSPLSACFLLLMASFLSACTQNQSSVETALKPQTTQTSPQTVANGTQVQASALVESGQASPTQTVTEAQTATGLGNENTTQIAALNTSKSLTFLPIEGAPTTAVTELSKSLRSSASSRGLTVLASTQPGAKYKVKGYFSALNDGSGTLVVYVWDVLDGAGKRLHRINGQERTGSSKPNPWLAITEVELQRVSERTADSLKAWIDNRQG